MASHGVGVVEIKEQHGQWRVKRSRLNRRITTQTPMKLTGPVRGSNLVKTKYSPKGDRTRGTLNNCASGYTPWGTYLTCEENWAGYFFNKGPRPREHSRYGVSTGVGNYGWGTRPEDPYARFNATPDSADYYDAQAAKGDYRNEPNNFGWVVEIDPFDPKSTPKKRTALGRMGHEGAWLAPTEPGRPIVVYMGDDSRGEYMYKFVSKKPYWPWSCNGDDLLDEGTLYVARFEDDGSGSWLALEFGRNGLTPENGFRDQADVLVNTRTAADFVGATRMDRPKWASIDPRAGNPDGHIIRWREERGRYWATEFKWDIFLFGGPTRETIEALGPVAPYNADPLYAVQAFPGSIEQTFLGEEASFNSPDGLWVDEVTGLLWIQTDGYSNAGRGFGNQQMFEPAPCAGFFVRPGSAEPMVPSHPRGYHAKTAPQKRKQGRRE